MASIFFIIFLKRWMDNVLLYRWRWISVHALRIGTRKWLANNYGASLFKTYTRWEKNYVHHHHAWNLIPESNESIVLGSTVRITMCSALSKIKLQKQHCQWVTSLLRQEKMKSFQMKLQPNVFPEEFVIQLRWCLEFQTLESSEGIPQFYRG